MAYCIYIYVFPPWFGCFSIICSMNNLVDHWKPTNECNPLKGAGMYPVPFYVVAIVLSPLLRHGINASLWEVFIYFYVHGIHIFQQERSCQLGANLIGVEYFDTLRRSVRFTCLRFLCSNYYQLPITMTYTFFHIKIVIIFCLKVIFLGLIKQLIRDSKLDIKSRKIF